MKKFKKILAIGLTVVSVVSSACISASAKTEIPLKNGATLIMYEEDDYIPEIPQKRSSVFSFSGNYPKYPNYDYIRDIVSGNSTITVPIGDDTIRITFSIKPSVCYMNVYGDYEGDYLTNGVNGLQWIQNPTTTFDIRGLHNGNYYIGFAGSEMTVNVAGTVSTY